MKVVIRLNIRSFMLLLIKIDAKVLYQSALPSH